VKTAPSLSEPKDLRLYLQLPLYSPERLKASLFGLTLIIKKPSNDQEQD